jgi:hypothetical protein
VNRTPASACVICGGATDEVFSALVLGKYRAPYRFCAACQHLRTPSPAWLKEAYSDAISRADTGLVARNLEVSRKLACVFHAFFDRQGRFLDTAGGTGLLTRLLRDVGFDVYWEDPHCTNLMAHGFEAPADALPYEAVTAIEVLEHLEDPLGFVRNAVARSVTSTLICTTELFRERPPPLDWWYYAFPTGQHISFYTAKTLAEIGRRLGLRLYSARGLHVFTRKNLNPLRYAWVVRRAGRGGFDRVRQKMRSRTDADHQRMLGQS